LQQFSEPLGPLNQIAQNEKLPLGSDYIQHFFH
jgi:hypothetical protein